MEGCFLPVGRHELIIAKGCPTQHTRFKRTEDASRGVERGFDNSGGEIP